MNNTKKDKKIMNEGYYKAQILSAKPIKNRFNKPGFELMFECGLYAEDGTTPAGEAEIYLEVSNAYGQPPMNDRTQKDITFQTLVSLGWAHGEDLSKLPTLVNSICQVRCKKDSKGNDRFYFSSRRPVEELDIASAQKLMAEMAGVGGAPAAGVFNANTAPAAPAASFGAAPAAPGNPFRR